MGGMRLGVVEDGAGRGTGQRWWQSANAGDDQGWRAAESSGRTELLLFCGELDRLVSLGLGRTSAHDHCIAGGTQEVEDPMVGLGVDRSGEAVATADPPVDRGDEIGPGPGAVNLRPRVDRSQLLEVTWPSYNFQNTSHGLIIPNWGELGHTVRVGNTTKTTDPDLRTKLRLPKGPVDWAALDPRATPGYPGKGKKDADEYRHGLIDELSDLQERLYAAGRAAAELAADQATEVDPAEVPSVLVLLQGMDTSGKGGVIRHAIGLVDPQGVQLQAFKAPTEEELSHDFLWRIRRALPEPGMIGIFDRSHYEDVLVVRVNELVPEKQWRARYDQINAFEVELAERGITLIKCFLNVSHAEQGERLAERLENPEKHWKYNPGDIDERMLWDDYQEAYADALRLCDSDQSPWYVIPADRKWYRNWAVAQLLLEHLRALDLGWPPADFDPEVELAELAATARD